MAAPRISRKDESIAHNIDQYFARIAEEYQKAESDRTKGHFFDEYVKLYSVVQMLDATVQSCTGIESACRSRFDEGLTYPELKGQVEKYRKESGTPQMTEIVESLKAMVNERLRVLQPIVETMVRQSLKPTPSGGVGGMIEDDASGLACQAMVAFNPESKECENWFDNIVGLDDAKRDLKDGFVNAFLYPNLFGKPASAVLLYGPPGTGKTLLAKALMNELERLSRYKSDGPPCRRFLFFAPTTDMFKGKYVGETEKKITAIFEGASRIACKLSEKEKVDATSIIFIDEVDSLAPSGRGEGGTQAQITGSAVNTLLQLMEGGVNKKDNVVVIAATNYPSSLDEAFLRRFLLQIAIDKPGIKDIEEMINFRVYNHLSSYKPIEKINAAAKEVCEKVMGKKEEAEEGGSDCKDKVAKHTGCVTPASKKSFDWRKLVGGDAVGKKLTDDAIKIFASRFYDKNYSGSDIERVFSLALKNSGRAAIRRNIFFETNPGKDDSLYYSLNCGRLIKQQKAKRLFPINEGDVDWKGRYTYESIKIKYEEEKDDGSKREARFYNALSTDSTMDLASNNIADEIYQRPADPTGNRPNTDVMIQFNVVLENVVTNNGARFPTNALLIHIRYNDIANTYYNTIQRWLHGEIVRTPSAATAEAVAALEDIWTPKNWFTEIFASLPSEVYMTLDVYAKDGKGYRITHKTVNTKLLMGAQYDTFRDAIQSRKIEAMIKMKGDGEYKSDNSNIGNPMSEVLESVQNYFEIHEKTPTGNLITREELTWTLDTENVTFDTTLISFNDSVMPGDCPSFMSRNARIVNWDIAPKYLSDASKKVKSSIDRDKYKKFVEYKKTFA